MLFCVSLFNARRPLGERLFLPSGLNSGLVLNVIMASRFTGPGGACQLDLSLNCLCLKGSLLPMGLGKSTGVVFMKEGYSSVLSILLAILYDSGPYPPSTNQGLGMEGWDRTLIHMKGARCESKFDKLTINN